MKRIAAIFLVICFYFTLLPVTAQGAITEYDEMEFDVTGELDYAASYDILGRVNALRQSLNLNELTMDMKMLEPAMQRAAELVLHFEHVRPDGSSIYSVFPEEALFSARGENIAMGQTSAEQVFAAWKNSPGHYSNMTSSAFNSIGIGAFNFNGKKYWVQLFSKVNFGQSAQPANRNHSYNIKLAGSLATNITTNHNAISNTFYKYADGTYAADEPDIPVVLQLQIASSLADHYNYTLPAKDVQYSIANSALGAVDATGKYVSLAPGNTSCTVTAKKYPKLSVTVPITSTVIDSPIYGIAWAKKSTKTVFNYGEAFSVNGSVKLRGYNDYDAKIPVTTKMCSGYNANQAGKQWITVRYKNSNVSMRYEITVKSKDNSTPNVAVKSVKLNMAAKTLARGQSVKLSAAILPKNASNKQVGWKSSNPRVVTVSSQGLVKAVGKGKATITVTTSSGKKIAKCAVVAGGRPVKSVAVSKKAVVLKLRKAATVKATLNPVNASNKKLIWSTSNSKVATVSASGKIIARGCGVATITVKTHDGFKAAKCRVTVK